TKLTTPFGVPARQPLELDHLGRTPGEQSDIAVVHLDGNGFGARIQRWLQHHVVARTPDGEVGELYEYHVLRLDEIMEKVEQAILTTITAAIGLDQKGQPGLRPPETRTALHLNRQRQAKKMIKK
ncbi:MAG: hypothetical protein LC808_09415, partial [Actinobacteria bacterium]|nr:hypothetical protein [Actinomycetota bacterium]